MLKMTKHCEPHPNKNSSRFFVERQAHGKRGGSSREAQDQDTCSGYRAGWGGCQLRRFHSPQESVRT